MSRFNITGTVTVSPSYKHEHKILLQYLLVHRAIPFVTLQNELKKLTSSEEVNLDNAIAIINETITRFSQRIVKLQCELSGETMCILISTIDREYFTKYKIFTEAQEEFFFKIVEAVIFSEGGFVGSINILNLSNTLSSPISKTVAEEYLDQFVQMKYLIKDDFGRYCMSPLAIAELKVYIDKYYQGLVQTCKICDHNVFVSKKCEGCNALFHGHCFMSLYQGLSEGNKRCRNCVPLDRGQRRFPE